VLAPPLLCAPENMDAYFDLFVVYRELGRHQEAEAVVDRGEQGMPGFRMRVGAPSGPVSLVYRPVPEAQRPLAPRT